MFAQDPAEASWPTPVPRQEAVKRGPPPAMQWWVRPPHQQATALRHRGSDGRSISPGSTRLAEQTDKQTQMTLAWDRDGLGPLRSIGSAAQSELSTRRPGPSAAWKA